MPRSAGSAAKRLKLRDRSETESEVSRRSRKTRGKLTRSNEEVGSLTIEKANRLAEKITGYHCIDLRLPNRKETDAADSMKWISTFDEQDVVIQRKLCMICMKNPMDAFLKPHVREIHPEVSLEVTEIIRRLSDVRYTRFCANGYIMNQTIDDKFPSISRVPLINFLVSCGFAYVRNEQKTIVNFEPKYEETDVRGVSKETAREIVSGFNRVDLFFHDEISFSADLVTSSRMLDPSTQTTVCCYVCHKISNIKNIARHVKVHEKTWNSEDNDCSLDDLTEVLKRITEVRTALYYAAQPIKYSRILKICEDNAGASHKLIDFLLESGYVVDSGDSEEVLTPTISPKMIVFGPNDEEIPALFKEGSEEKRQYEDAIEEEMPDLLSEIERISRSPTMAEVCESDFSTTEQSESITRSRSSSVTSETSSASSTSSSRSRITLRPCSSPSDEPFPYCVLNGITEHIAVEHALFGLLEALTDDPNYTLNQPQFGFLLGYTSYCLVVANGSKQNVISKLKMGDYMNARFDESSGLRYFSFSTKSTCNQKDVIEYLCADEKVWRAMEIFEAARERRAQEAMWIQMDDESAPFFCSYTSPFAITKDTNYPMSQFLRMCGLDWPCRSNAICSAAWSLVPRDNEKSGHHQYSITYFKLLREKERSQVQLIDDGGQLSSHPTYKKITSIVVSKANNKEAQPKKVRKPQKRYIPPERRGVPNRPRGGDHKSEEFLRRTGREVPERPPKKEPKWRRRTKKEMIEAGAECDLTTTVVPVDTSPQEEQLIDFDAGGHEDPNQWTEPNEFYRPTEVLDDGNRYKIEIDGDRVLTCL